MRRFILIAALAVAAAAPSIGRADVSGCSASIGNAGVCRFRAAAGAGFFRATTPSGWNVTVVRDNVRVTLAAGTGTIEDGAFDVSAGEIVTVTLLSDWACVATTCVSPGQIFAGTQ